MNSWPGMAARAIDQFANCGNDLNLRKRLRHQDALGYTVDRPLVGRRSRHVDDREVGAQIARMAGYFPAIRAFACMDVGDEHGWWRRRLEQVPCFGAAVQHRDVEAACLKRLHDHLGNEMLVFDE